MKFAIQRRARLNAERGVRYLDAVHPGWARKVSPGMNVRSGTCCIVAEITKQTFERGVAILGLVDPVSLGFYVPGDQNCLAVIAEYALLTAEFHRARMIRLRAAAAAAARKAEVRSAPLDLVAAAYHADQPFVTVVM